MLLAWGTGSRVVLRQALAPCPFTLLFQIITGILVTSGGSLQVIKKLRESEGLNYFILRTSGDFPSLSAELKHWLGGSCLSNIVHTRAYTSTIKQIPPIRLHMFVPFPNLCRFFCLSRHLARKPFVFATPWQSRWFPNRTFVTRSSDRTYSLLSLAPSGFSIKCSVVPYPIPNVLFSSSPMSSSLSIAEYFSLTSDSIQ